MIIIPPSHEKSWLREDIFLPVIPPIITAAKPAANVIIETAEVFMSVNPQESPIAAESSELARASIEASPAVSTLEWSVSADVSSRYKLITSPIPFILRDILPHSERRLNILLAILLKIVINPIKVSTIRPPVRKIEGGIKPPIKSEKVREKPSIPPLIRLITAAEETGIFISLLLYAAAARYVSILTARARKISLYIVTLPFVLLYVKGKVSVNVYNE